MKVLLIALGVAVVGFSILVVAIIPTPVLTFMGGVLVFLAPIALAAFFFLAVLAAGMKS